MGNDAILYSNAQPVYPSVPSRLQLPTPIPLPPQPPALHSRASIVPVAPEHITALRRINSLLLPISYPDSFYASVLDPHASGLFSRVILWHDPRLGKEPRVVGGIVCRLEAFDENDLKTNTLGVTYNGIGDRTSGGMGGMGSSISSSSSSSISSSSTNNKTGKDPSAPEAVAAARTHAIYIQSLALLSPNRNLGLASAALDHIVASARLLGLQPPRGIIDVRVIYAHVWSENDEGLRWYERRGFDRQGRWPHRGYYTRLQPDTAWVVWRDIEPLESVAAAAAKLGPVNMVTQPAPMQTQTPTQTPTPMPTFMPTFIPTTTPMTPPMPAPMLTPMTTMPTANSSTSAAAAVVLPPLAAGTVTGTGGGSWPSAAQIQAMFPQMQVWPQPSWPQLLRPPVPSPVSYQNARPDTEWNDLPADMMTSSGTPGATRDKRGSPRTDSVPGSGASSRTNSATRKKKERAYPAASFSK